MRRIPRDELKQFLNTSVNYGEQQFVVGLELKVKSIMIEKITGESQVLDTLERMYIGRFTTEEALEIICSIFRENLAHFSAIENIHNTGKIANLLSIKLFPSRILSKVIVQWIQQERYQEFTDDLDFEYAILRGCAVLLLAIIEENPSKIPSITANKLFKYIENIGALPEDYIE